MASGKPREPRTVAPRCPICREPTDAAYRPFCSSRCRDVDLARWMRGTYAIPGGQADADEDGEDAAAQRAPRVATIVPKKMATTAIDAVWRG